MFRRLEAAGAPRRLFGCRDLDAFSPALDQDTRIRGYHEENEESADERKAKRREDVLSSRARRPLHQDIMMHAVFFWFVEPYLFNTEWNRRERIQKESDIEADKGGCSNTAIAYYHITLLASKDVL